ncbi:MAG: hypothetical protein AAGJ68_05590 [Pseudomonadota bacterium]
MSKPDETPETKQNRLLVRLSLLQLIPAVVGIFIATLALYAALNESDAVRKQQQAAVWPHLQIDRTNITTDVNTGISMSVSNRGIGPARVRAASMRLDGESLENWSELFEKIQPETSGFFPRNDANVGQSVLSPGGTVRVIDVNTELFATYNLEGRDGIATVGETESLVFGLREAFRTDRIEMELCYCSVFDDCWHVSSIERDPNPVRNCTVYLNENSF